MTKKGFVKKCLLMGGIGGYLMLVTGSAASGLRNDERGLSPAVAPRIPRAC